MQRNQYLIEKIDELVKLGFNSDRVPPDLTKKLLRLLRPTGPDVDEHAPAVRHRLRETILSQPSGDTEGLLVVSKFDKECEYLKRLNPNVVNPFLSLVEPLTKPRAVLDLFTGSQAASRDASHSVTAAKGTPKGVERFELEALSGDPAQEAALIQELSHIWVSKDVELMLIKDLLYVFQGVSCKHIRYDPRSESYLVDPALKLPAAVRDTVLSLCELGWLFSKVVAYSTASESGELSKGLVVQAFGFALQEELHDYYRLLAVLEQELSKKSSRAVKGADVTASQASLTIALGSSGLTLLRMRTWLQEPIDRMCLLAKLVDAVGPLTGGALASRLYGHRRHGDASVTAVVLRVMDSVCAPIYSILTRWILYGDLRDPYNEFFICVRENTAALTANIWLDTYQLRQGMLPSFFSLDLAHKILVIGKSINFIRVCKNKGPGVKREKKVVDKGERKSIHFDSAPTPIPTPKASSGIAFSPSKPTPGLKKGLSRPSVAEALGFRSADFEEEGHNEVEEEEEQGDDVLLGISEDVEQSLYGLRCGGEAELAELVNQVSESVDNRLLRMMDHDFHLADHLLALKKFMLLGQGDFVTCLMDSVGPELQKAPGKLYRHNLTGILEGALRASNAQFEPAYVLNRVVVRLLDPSHGDTGWDVFTLDYSVDMPLNAVIHAEAIAKYRIAFHMLWRVKRVEWSLAAAWKQLMSLSHSAWRGYGRDGRAAWRAEFPNLLPVLHRCTLSRGKMMHVLNNLSAFIMFEVLESAWNTLLDSMKRAKCLDDIIKAHDSYLTEILDRALLASHHEALNLQVQRLLQSILRFCTVESSLITDATVAMSRRRRAREETKGAPVRGTDPALLDIPGSFDGVAGYMVTRVDEAVEEYNTQFEVLMAMLREQGERAGDIIRNLTFRLNFNDYNSSSNGKTAAVRVVLDSARTRSDFEDSYDSTRASKLTSILENRGSSAGRIAKSRGVV